MYLRITFNQPVHPKEIQHEPYNLHTFRKCRLSNPEHLYQNLLVFKFYSHDTWNLFSAKRAFILYYFSEITFLSMWFFEHTLHVEQKKWQLALLAQQR